MITPHTPDIKHYQEGEYIKSPNLFGIEIEVEDNFVKEDDIENLRYWVSKEDHSLRGDWAREYVLSTPLTGKDLELSLKEIEPYISKATASSRCSVHIHVDVRGWTEAHFNRFICYWVALEKVLVQFSGQREENIFCFPFYRTQDFSHVIKNLENNFKGEHGVKYTALNFLTASTLGSLEIRTHRGTTDPQDILEWLLILSELIEYTRNEESDLSNLPEFYSGKGPIEFLKDVFPSSWERLMFPSVASYLLQGIRNVQSIMRIEKLTYFYFHPLTNQFRSEKDLYSKWQSKRNS